jgi:hypothetical protein
MNKNSSSSSSTSSLSSLELNFPTTTVDKKNKQIASSSMHTSTSHRTYSKTTKKNFNFFSDFEIKEIQINQNKLANEEAKLKAKLSSNYIAIQRHGIK